MKKPWETSEGAQVWKDSKGTPSESQYWTWLRGAMRRIWADYPLRKVWKQSQLRPVTQEEKDAKLFHPSTKNVGLCSFCNTWMAGSKLECDHIVESDGCTSKETAESFLWHCGGLTGEDFRLACKPCHKIQSYAQKQSITYEEAAKQKKIIQILKDKEDKIVLQANGISPASSEKARRKQLEKLFDDKEVWDSFFEGEKVF